MANIALKPGQVYEMGMIGGTPVVFGSTDHVHAPMFIRNDVQITGSLMSDEAELNRLYRLALGSAAHEVTYTDEGRALRIARNDSNGSWISFHNSTTQYNTTDGFIVGIDSNERARLHGYTDVDFLNIYLNNTHEFQFQNDGDFHADGDVIAYSSTTSDIRLKTNIRPLSSSLNTICKLNGIKFDWKYRDQTNELGLIAQQVEKHVPEVVKEKQLPFYASSSVYTDDQGVEHTKIDETEYKVVRYDQLVPHLIESIKELKLEIDELKSKLENK